MIETLDKLAHAIKRMSVGERLDLPHADYRTLWPRPPIHCVDDYLSDEERAQKWCCIAGCRIWQNYGRSGLTIEKISAGGEFTKIAQPDEPMRRTMMSAVTGAPVGELWHQGKKLGDIVSAEITMTDEPMR